MAMKSTSRARLALCHPDLIQLFEKVAEQVDIVITEGHREVEAEALNIKNGTSHLKDPLDCLHCREPSLAVDCAVAGEKWNDPATLIDFAMNTVKPAAEALGLTIRWGGAWADRVDWTRNPPHSFDDLYHFELHQEG